MLEPTFTYPTAVSTDPDRLALLYRLQQRLIDQHNARCPSLAPAGRAAFQRDWELRLLRLHTEINRLRARLHPPTPDTLRDPSVSIARYREKLSARRALTWDAALAGHDLLRSAQLAGIDPDPLEDLTTYVETDPNDRYAVSAHAITATGLTRADTVARVYADKGIGHFGTSFTHLSHARITQSSYGAAALFWGLSNALSDLLDWYNNSRQALCIRYNDYQGHWILLTDWETLQQDSYDGSVNTDYYFRHVRSGANGTTLTSTIYSDPDRTSILDTLTCSVTANRAYRYVFAANNFSGGLPEYAMSFVVSNLDLGGRRPVPSPAGPLAALAQPPHALAR